MNGSKETSSGKPRTGRPPKQGALFGPPPGGVRRHPVTELISTASIAFAPTPDSSGLIRWQPATFPTFEILLGEENVANVGKLLTVTKFPNGQSTVSVPGDDFRIEWPVRTILKTKSHYHLCGTDGGTIPPCVCAAKELSLAMEGLFREWLQ